MVTRDEDGTAGRLSLVVNAARKAADLPTIERSLPDGVSLRPQARALLALQGPEAERALTRFVPEAAEMAFMSARLVSLFGEDILVSRSGYTGEDGFEISVPAAAAEEIARALLDSDSIEPIGLGARDSLRLEAGLCLYGHDIDETTTPVEEADLTFTIGKRRREDKDFPGAHRILPQLACGAGRKRVGLRPEGRAPVRGGADITDEGETVIGRVTSGTYGPSAGGPVAMGYVPPEYAETGNSVGVIIRGRRHEAQISALPFVPHRYRRPAAKPVQTREATSR